MNEEMDEWEQYEEDGLLDLEEQLDRALDRAFPNTAKAPKSESLP